MSLLFVSVGYLYLKLLTGHQYQLQHPYGSLPKYLLCGNSWATVASITSFHVITSNCSALRIVSLENLVHDLSGVVSGEPLSALGFLGPLPKKRMLCWTVKG